MEEHATMQESARKTQDAARRLEERTREAIGDAGRNASQVAGLMSETNSTWAEAGGRLFDELIQFSTMAVKEQARAVSELQQIGLDSVRDTHNAFSRWQRNWTTGFGDPLRWWQSALEETVDSAQRSVALTQRTAEVMSNACRRVQTTAEQSGRALQETLRGATARMQDLYARAEGPGSATRR
jgi:hypothetical protein